MKLPYYTPKKLNIAVSKPQNRRAI